MPNYARIAASAARALARAGVAATLTKVTPDDYDPATGTQDSLSSADFLGSAVRDSYSLREIDGTRIRQGDVRLYLAVGALPETGDAIALAGDSVPWIVVTCSPIQPGDTAVLYDVQARRP